MRTCEMNRRELLRRCGQALAVAPLTPFLYSDCTQVLRNIRGTYA